MTCDPSTLATNAKTYQKNSGFEEEIITYLLCQWAATIPIPGDGILGEQGDSLGGEGGGIILGE